MTALLKRLLQADRTCPATSTGPPPSSPSPPPLSAARLALAALVVESKKAATMRSRIDEARRELAQATEVETGVHAQLDALGRDERAGWDEWAQAGANGTRPAPRAEQRAQLTLALTDAQTIRAQAEQALDALMRGSEGIFSEHAAALARQLDKAVAAVLVEEAELVMSSYVEHAREAALDEERLHAITAVLQSLKAWPERDKLFGMVRGARQRMLAPFKTEAGRQLVLDARAAWGELAARLREDASVQIRNEPTEPEPGDAA